MQDLKKNHGSRVRVDSSLREIDSSAIRKGIVVIFAKPNLCLPTETRPHSNSAGICERECGLASDESSEIL